MSTPNGLVIWRGLSRLTRAPVVVVLTGLTRDSANEATGGMLQTWILVDGAESPAAAVHTGNDVSVCGDCPHRSPASGGIGTCYVGVQFAPTVVYKAMRRGIYPVYDPAEHNGMLRGRLLRIGSYGDPGAVPVDVWRRLARVCGGRTGYTHQWRLRAIQGLRTLLMASVDSVDEAEEAKALGWRTFRVRHVGSPLERGEIECPKSARAGKRLTCEQCLACHGQTASGRGASVSIEVHGAPNKIVSYRRRFALDVLPSVDTTPVHSLKGG
jgi:hypothetical protein